jgi:DNA modification methylase
MYKVEIENDIIHLVEEPQLDLFNPNKYLETDSNALLNFVNEYYTKFENTDPINIINKSQFNTPVNFKQAKSSPIHRWYTYKEGFSPFFVRQFIERFKTSDQNVVFDPFGGIGTTVVESTLLGFNAFSNDVNPLSNFIAKVKAEHYSKNDLSDLENEKKKIYNHSFQTKNNPPDNETVSSYFSEITLDSVLKVQAYIDTLKNEKVRNLIFITLLTILESISTHRKDGNGVKRKKNFKCDFSLDKITELLINQIDLFIFDIKNSHFKNKSIIQSQSSFDEYTLPQKADLVITSPPYANCFDYSKVYLVELWFGGFFKSKVDQKNFRESSIISHVHYKWNIRHQDFGHSLINKEIYEYLSKQNLWDRKIPQMLVGYFNDIGKVLFELSKNLNNGATVGFVVGNSVYGGVPIATDILLAEIGVKLGYELIGIESYRTLTSSSQQQKIIREQEKKFLRESLVILKWK